MHSNVKEAEPSRPSEQRPQDGGTHEEKAETRKEGRGRVRSLPTATHSALRIEKTEEASTSPETKGAATLISSGTLPATTFISSGTLPATTSIPGGTLPTPDRKPKPRKIKEHCNQPPQHASDQVPEGEIGSGAHQDSSIVKSSIKRRKSKKFFGTDARLDKAQSKPSETSPKDVADSPDAGRNAGVNTGAAQTDVEMERKTVEKPGRTIEAKADDAAAKGQSKTAVKVMSPQVTSPNSKIEKTLVDTAAPASAKPGRLAKTLAERRRQSNLEAEQRSLFLYSTLKELATTLKTESAGPMTGNQMSLSLQKLQYHVAWVVTVAVVFTAAVALLMWMRSGKREFVRNACVTPACLDHASVFQDLLNYSVDPCVDLHGFVCSKGTTQEPGGGRDATSFVAHLIRRHMLKMVRLFLDGSTNFEASKMATDFLKECTGAYKSPPSVDSLIAFFEFVPVPWPFDQSSKPELHPLEAVLILSLKWGIYTWFRAYINTARKTASNSSAKQVLFIEASLWLDFVRTVGDRRDVYYEQVHKLYNASLPNQSRRQRMLSTEMGVLSILDTARAPGTVMRPAVTTVARLASAIRNATVDQWLEAVQSAPRGAEMNDATVVSVQDVRVLRAVDKLLFAYSEDALSEHLSWWLVQILTVIGWPEGYYVIAGSQEAATVDVSVECYRMLAVRFGLLLTSESAINFFTRESRRELEAFLAGLLVFLGGVVYKSPWLDNDTKVALEDRLAAVKVALWPPFVEGSNSTLWQLYAGFCVTCKRDSARMGDAPTTATTKRPALMSIWWQVNARFWALNSTQLEYMQLRWQADALDAFLYEPVNNRLRVSHAALLSPLFHPASAELRQANYGGLGAAFMANVLRMYTAPDEEIDADILPEPWANFTSLAAQRARILNCSTELLSNLRDVAALGIAWQALKASNSSRFDGGQSSAGAGLYIADGDSRHYYSGDQLFFLTYCLSRCEEDVRLHRPRGPGCNAAVRGVRDFGSVFQCRKGTPMVPSESCDITQVL